MHLTLPKKNFFFQCNNVNRDKRIYHYVLNNIFKNLKKMEMINAFDDATKNGKIVVVK